MRCKFGKTLRTRVDRLSEVACYAARERSASFYRDVAINLLSL